MFIAQSDAVTTAIHTLPMHTDLAEERCHWYALSTLPRNERSVARSLELRGFEVFLPTYEAVKTWRNRQRVTVQVPLFVGYVFLRVRLEERSRALSTTGAVRFVGNSRGPVAIPSSEIEFLRTKYCAEAFKPYQDLVVGQQVRVWRGVMKGIEGVLVRKDKDVRFVLTIKLINQHIAAIVEPADLEAV